MEPCNLHVLNVIADAAAPRRFSEGVAALAAEQIWGLVAGGRIELPTSGL